MKSGSRLFRWQVVTIALMVVGYGGYYFCRSNLAVCTNSIAKELAVTYSVTEAEAKQWIGGIVSLSILTYALGKFVSGGLADFWGGRRNYLFGMFGSIACTVAFAMGGAIPIFSIAWMANRLVQSMGWTGMMKISSRWFSHTHYGTVVGIISVSFLFGDAIARWFMGELLAWGLGWRGVFYSVAGVLGVIAILNLFLIKETPLDLGEPEPDANPDNLFAEEKTSTNEIGDTSPSAWSLFQLMLTNPAFLTVCLLSFGFTFLRETFNAWTPSYFQDSLKLSEQSAARWSALFPLLGGVSVLLAGFLSDRLGAGGRSLLLFLGLAATTLGLLALGLTTFGVGAYLIPIALVSAIGFVMIGPYSYLGGAIALDFGGKKASATACGLIDGIGYLGAILSGWAVAAVAKSWGWQGAFLMMASVAAASTITAAFYLVAEKRKARLRTSLD